MDEDELEALIRELLEDDELDVGLLVERLLTEEIIEAVEERDELELRDENGVLDEEIVARLLRELVGDEELETVDLEDSVDIEDADEDLESPEDLDAVEDDVVEADSLAVPVPLGDIIGDRVAEIELVEVRVIKDDQVQ